MLKGIMAGDVVVLTSDGSGLDVVDSDPPTAWDGYMVSFHWENVGNQITKVWEYKPIEGSPEEAMLKLSQLQAKSLPDEYALEVPALYSEWIAGETYYGPDKDSSYAGDRIRYHGVLYKVLQGHVSQADWTPDVAPSLYAQVLPGQEGNEPEEGYAEWVQPGSTNGYALGDRVMHNGKIWESAFDGANVWEPGVVGTEALWKDVTDEVSSDDQGGVEE